MDRKAEIWGMIENWIVIYKILSCEETVFTIALDYEKTKNDVKEQIISLAKNYLEKCGRSEWVDVRK